MVQRRKSKFADLKDRAWRAATDWSMEVASQPLPTPIHELARLHKVQAVRFEPLLSTAGLMKGDDGYVIVSNTEAVGAPQDAGATLEADSRWDNFEPPFRFTLAHEICHLFFSDGRGLAGKQYFVRHHAQLEKACNEMAGLILMPKQRLVSEIGDRPFATSHLKSVTHRFRVSPEVFVRRLKINDIQDAFGGLDGLIALIRAEGETFSIVASHFWGVYARSRFQMTPRLRQNNHEVNSKQSNDPASWQIRDFHLGIDVDTVLRSSDYWEEKLPVRCKHKLELPCEFNACLTGLRPRTFIISIQVLGPPIKREDTGKGDALLFPG